VLIVKTPASLVEKSCQIIYWTIDDTRRKRTPVFPRRLFSLLPTIFVTGWVFTVEIERDLSNQCRQEPR